MPKSKFISSMVLSAGHSIMVGNVPKGVDTDSLSKNYFKAAKVDISKYGLFSSDIDYNTYFPDVTKKDFNPETDEFIEPVFRLLSNCIVSKNYTPTEFPEDVLKESIPLLIGQTVNCDHETNIGNAIGSVKEAFWQDSYQIDGKDIPGGINGILKIDGKANPRIVRGIMMEPPSIHSNSVTVQFEWKPSHNFENPWEFWDKLGTYDENGEMIRRIVTKIISYKETSLVSHGADPYAQKLDKNGKIINPGYADSVYNSFSEEVKEKICSGSVCDYDYKGDYGIALMHNTSIINNNKEEDLNVKPNKNVSSMNKELQEFLEKLFGENMLSLSEGNSASIDLALSEVKRIITENNQFKSHVSSLQNEINILKEAAETNKPFITMGKDYFSELKNSTMAAYKKIVGEGKEDANIIALIEGVDSVSTLKSLRSSYESQLEEKFPLHCDDCGSNNISRASSISNNSEVSEEVNNSSTEDILNRIASKKR